MSNEVHCPKCDSTQITANKKGFSGKKAVVGAVLTGGIGLLAGTIGSKKVIITCLSCEYEFSPGDRPIIKKPSFDSETKIIYEPTPPVSKSLKIAFLIVAILLITTLILTVGTSDKKVVAEPLSKKFNIDSLITLIKSDKLYHVKDVDYTTDTSSLRITIKEKAKYGMDQYFDQHYLLNTVPALKEITVYRGNKIQYSHNIQK